MNTMNTNKMFKELSFQLCSCISGQQSHMTAVKDNFELSQVTPKHLKTTTIELLTVLNLLKRLKKQH